MRNMSHLVAVLLLLAMAPLGRLAAGSERSEEDQAAQIKEHIAELTKRIEEIEILKERVRNTIWFCV